MKSICFCGPDGVGKSTQVKAVVEYFQKENFEVRVIHLFSSDSTALSSLHKRKNIRLFLEKMRSIKKSPTGVLMRDFLRIVHAVIDSWISWFFFGKSTNGVCVFDRYFYDILVIIGAGNTNTIIRKLAVFMSLLIPKPDLIFFLEANPRVILKRKQELSLSKIRNLESWYRIIGLRNGAIFINANLKPEKVTERIVKFIEDRGKRE
jgi:thymidylate kinase